MSAFLSHSSVLSLLQTAEQEQQKPTAPSFYDLEERKQLAYHHHKAGITAPTVVFLGGFRSDMQGSKATFLEAFCQKQKVNYLRFDYQGHGQSSSRFRDCTLSTWLEDSLTLVDALTEGPLYLVGSSMGGWLSLLLAQKRLTRVQGFIGIAAAPDFTEELMWGKATKEQQQTLQTQGLILVPNTYGEPYEITMDLIKDGKKHLLLNAPIPLNCPVHLLQGQDDQDVDPQMPFRIAKALTSENLRCTLIKKGTHSLSRPEDLSLLAYALSEMLTNTSL